ncbi:hypothetical protein TNCT_276301 [Trichonephila clavata]|uniref:Uncharacterized protein n=1 Tax=Trichonephila clavata TaxID=2740835 RepID=A0A8X6HM18_TRICU|nr:hypothetical protein TNCT_276301 [Trichonephila clavata]
MKSKVIFNNSRGSNVPNPPFVTTEPFSSIRQTRTNTLKHLFLIAFLTHLEVREFILTWESKRKLKSIEPRRLAKSVSAFNPRKKNEFISARFPSFPEYALRDQDFV